jgi:predicted transcriptional regulator
MARRATDSPNQLWTHVVQALVTKETSEQLSAKAARLGLSRSAAGRRAIEQYVEREDQPEDAQGPAAGD